MPVERDCALFELLMERIASLRGAGWTFCQVVEQLEWELFVLHQWQRQWQERDVRVWNYGQLRRVHPCQNLPEELRRERETTANRTSVTISTIESTVTSGLIIYNRSFETRLQSRISIIRLPFSRRCIRLRQYRERADWGVARQSVASRRSDNRVHFRQRLFLLWIRLRYAECDTMCIISYNTHSRIVERVWISHVHFIIQLILVQFLREVEGMFSQQGAARLPETRQLLWPASSPRLFPIEMYADVRNWIELRIFHRQ